MVITWCENYTIIKYTCKSQWADFIEVVYLQMLLNLHKKSWMDGLTLKDYSKHCTTNEETVKHMLELAKNYNKVSIMNLLHLVKLHMLSA